MNRTQGHVNVNPMVKANFISKALFCWLGPLFREGYKRSLDSQDLYNVIKNDSSEYLGNKLEEAWNKQLEKIAVGKKPSLRKALFAVFGFEYLRIGFLMLLEGCAQVIQPILLGNLIQYFVPDSGVSRDNALIYAGGVSLCAVTLAIIHHPYFFIAQIIGMRMRIACCSLMYRKCLRLSNRATSQTTVGQIVNIMSNDVNRFDQAMVTLHFLWTGPIHVTVVLVILWYELGSPVFAGFSVYALIIPFQYFMAKSFSKLRRKTADRTDERIKAINDILIGIRIVKMYCWEKPLSDLIEKIRKLELIYIRKARRAQAYNLILNYITTSFVQLLIFSCLVLIGRGDEITSRKVFLVVGLILMMRATVTQFIPFAFQQMAESNIVIKRIQKFLLLEEVKRSSSNSGESKHDGDHAYVEVKNITAKWDDTIEQNTLDNISFEVNPGELLAVIGPVGSGKTSLLMSVLHELPLSKGSINVRGKLAYVSQQPRIFSGSVRQNITIGSVFEKARYDRIVKACALRRDFDIMPEGDLTFIGDRGVSLSGGQKARVALARALYADADVYLLDDPLSAVDPIVASHLFYKCFLDFLKSKPKILVTHQFQFLAEANNIIILKEGRIDEQGSFDTIVSSGVDVDISALLQRKNLDLVSESSTTFVSTKKDRNRSSTPSISTIEVGVSGDEQVNEYEELRASGTVGLAVYINYFKAGTGFLQLLILVMTIISAEVFKVSNDLWLVHWSNQEGSRSQVQYGNNTPSNGIVDRVDSDFNMMMLVILTVSLFVLGLTRVLLFFRIAINSSDNLHKQMFNRILRSPIQFFDKNPVGRILNRFAKDMGNMDEILPYTFFEFIQISIITLGIILVAGFSNPLIFIPTAPLGLLFVLIRQYYLKTSRSIKRLEGTSRSPVISYLTATLQGIHTIRSLDMDEKFIKEFDFYQNQHTEAFFLFLAVTRWLAVRLDWLCAAFIIAVTFSSVIETKHVSPGLIGLSITYTMTLMGMFQWGVRQSAEVENQMVSVERVLEYTQLPTEAELESEQGKKPMSDWPNFGTIKAKDACLRYTSGGPLVLKNLNFVINGKEKIGIVGRTGAGKSSMISMLFRLVEPTGIIEIDHIDIKSVGLYDLRKAIAIIPQDLFLFAGSVRKNLDPCDHYDDSLLWKALDDVQLKKQIADLPEGLSSEVSEGGCNFSVGQRQLICLARAHLRNNRILVIDEATANVDPKTDRLIQRTIRTKFKECTVLTIAHRLNTIMDSDRVMVLDMGTILEFDEPYTLLQNTSGHLYKMAKQVDEDEFEKLRAIAKLASTKTETPANTLQSLEKTTINSPLTLSKTTLNSQIGLSR